ncbi:MAG TPA: hypothetical protein VGQ48_10670 [Gemmatimonadales bacterium]|jgi:hypothetical protein|nr:hypothetical protein [Gemmatimonadales bacterium]
MRHAALVTLSLGFLVACESNGKISPATVQWMDWPAEVNAGQSFRTRLVVWGVCATNPRFRAGVRADQSAVTFAPYFLIDDENILCLGARVEDLLVTAIDTAGMAPGLAAPLTRTYEMRAAALANVWAVDLLASFPVRTFGDVTVRRSGSDASRRNAAGLVSVERDSLGCVRVRPFGLYHPAAALVLEDQADTAGLSYAFARGYIHDAAAPVCGQTRVFHLVSRN